MKFTYIKYFFVPAKSDQSPDPDPHGFAFYIEVKNWIRIHIDSKADLQHCFDLRVNNVYYVQYINRVMKKLFINILSDISIIFVVVFLLRCCVRTDVARVNIRFSSPSESSHKNFKIRIISSKKHQHHNKDYYR